MWKHGASAYSNGLCKCLICTKANTERTKKYYHQNKKQLLPKLAEYNRNKRRQKKILILQEKGIKFIV